MEDFLLAWSLFRDTWLTALMLAALLPFCGVVLLLRRQVFLGAAVGQAASLGIALTLWLGLGEGHADHGSSTPALAAGLLAAMITAVLALRSLSGGGSDLEARSALVFLLGGSGAMVLLADAPHGMQELQRLLLSSLLGASIREVLIAAALLVATAAIAVARSRRILLWATDPATSAALGVPVLRYDVLVGAWLGGCLGFAIHTAGLPFAFGAAVLPVLLARELCGSLHAVILAAPVIGVISAAVGLVAAHTADRPPGQAAVLVAALGLAIVRLFHLLRGTG
ncbi:MAG TPA: metal ABC transporter permease [Planctomycetota bacterium]|nr:metal ABC transporter permease [Planctomycetota bacterium]